MIKDCKNCGLCKSVCPVYKVTLMEKYSPLGKIKIIRNKINSDVFNFCTLCGACKEICPLDIDIPKAILKARRSSASNKNI